MKSLVLDFQDEVELDLKADAHVFPNMKTLTVPEICKESYIIPVFTKQSNRRIEIDPLNRIKKSLLKGGCKSKFVLPKQLLSKTELKDDRVIPWDETKKKNAARLGGELELGVVDPIYTPLMLSLILCAKKKIKQITILGINFAELDEHSKRNILHFISLTNHNGVALSQISTELAKIPSILNFNKESLKELVLNS